MIAEGKHKAKVTGSFCGESSEKKTKFAGIEFTTESNETIFWTGYMTETEFSKADGSVSTPAKETLKTLIEIGFIGSKISDLSSDDTEKIFNEIEDDIYIVVEHEEYVKKDGEIGTMPKVKYVNIGAGGPQRFTKEQAVKSFAGTNFDAELMKLRKSIKPKVKQEPEATSEADDDDVPF